MNSTFRRCATVGLLAGCLASSALGATIKETYTLKPSGEKATFTASPDVIRSIVEDGAEGQSVALVFKAYPEDDRHIVKMYIYVSRSVQRDLTFEYHHPVAIEGRPEKRGAQVWSLPQDADRPPVFNLSDQNIAAPTRIFVYVIEKDNEGKSYSTLVETHYAALHAAFVENR